MDSRLDSLADRVSMRDKLVYSITTSVEVKEKFSDIAQIIAKLFESKVKEAKLILVPYSDLYKNGMFDHEGNAVQQFYQKSSSYIESGYTEDFIIRFKKDLPKMVQDLVDLMKYHKWTKLYTLELPMGTFASERAGIARLVVVYDINTDDFLARIDVMGAK